MRTYLAGQPDKLEELSNALTSLTPRGGRHHIFRQPPGRIWGNTTSRLAPKVDTRANGGYIVAPPSEVDGKPYRWETGGLSLAPGGLPEPPDWLVELVDKAAVATCKVAPATRKVASGVISLDADVERRAVAYLAAMPPAISGQGGHNATYAAATALVHGFCIAPEQALSILLEHYNPRCQPPWTERELRHKVDDAATRPHEYALGWLRDRPAEHVGTCVPAGDVDLSALLPNTLRREKPPATLEDPGPMPLELLRVPGFVSEVMDFSLETAPYPNYVMAFAGALSLQAYLAGRKVRDPGDNRTNLYLLGLAYSSVGKDRPREVNTQITTVAGLREGLGDKFASGEGIQDALFLNPCMLFQTDEIDGLLQSINKAKDARHESIMGTLLTMHSAARTSYPMRRKAGKDLAGIIDQPHLVIFGTAIPNHYYEALSERMLTNGFFGRMIILESGPRSDGQEPVIRDLPARIVDTARWWAAFPPGQGNLRAWHPVPLIVEHTDDAKKALIETRLESEAEYKKAEGKSDPVGTTVWGRVSEQTRKLALVYAASENHQSPRITLPAVEWARRLMMHQTRRMLFMAQAHVAENPFHADCLKVMEKLRSQPK